jgi:hypothetical protein
VTQTHFQLDCQRCQPAKAQALLRRSYTCIPAFHRTGSSATANSGLAYVRESRSLAKKWAVRSIHAAVQTVSDELPARVARVVPPAGPPPRHGARHESAHETSSMQSCRFCARQHALRRNMKPVLTGTITKHTRPAAQKAPRADCSSCVHALSAGRRGCHPRVASASSGSAWMSASLWIHHMKCDRQAGKRAGSDASMETGSGCIGLPR